MESYEENGEKSAPRRKQHSSGSGRVALQKLLHQPQHQMQTAPPRMLLLIRVRFQHPIETSLIGKKKEEKVGKPPCQNQVTRSRACNPRWEEAGDLLVGTEHQHSIHLHCISKCFGHSFFM